RPGPTWWSIAAGPLVNVALVPVTVGLVFAGRFLNWEGVAPDVDRFVLTLAFVNFLLLCFNLLPIYPLDGGQILHALLWRLTGFAEALLAVSIIGMLAGLAVLTVALLLAFLHSPGSSWWLAVVAAFLLCRSLP